MCVCVGGGGGGGGKPGEHENDLAINNSITNHIITTS